MSGLNDSVKKDWPKLTSADAARTPMERLAGDRPQDKELHDRIKTYLTLRLNHSELKMKTFHSRWRLAEMRHQAYINLPDYEKMLKAATESGAPPEITSIVVPYSFATINTIVTYLVNAFTGRKPIFQLGTNKKESMNAVQYQEILLQQNADHTRLVRHLYQFLNDGQIYGVSVLRTGWRKVQKMRTVKTSTSIFGMLSRVSSSRQLKTVYAGNEVACIDPFMFFPDPRVPMAEVNRRGEYVFWRTYSGKHELLTLEEQGVLVNVEKAGSLPADSRIDSLRNPIGNMGTARENNGPVATSIQEDTCVIKLIPAELGLGDKRFPEMWLFTLLNKQVIAQAIPLETDHDMIPVCVSEPYTVGYGFGHTGMSDLLAPIQDSLSWLINSHIYNVRATLNNSWIVDPSRVEVQDLKTNKPGKIIRVKQAAMGQDVRTMIQQLESRDVTTGHISDFGVFMRLGDAMSSVNDNARGQVQTSNRTTATEARISTEAGSSRLASMARLISAQAMVDLAEQMSINIMQYMDEEFVINVVGPQGNEAVKTITPMMVMGDFYYPVHDGSLPIDKVAMLEVWKEIFMGVARDPQLRQTFDLVKIFKHAAEMGGAKDIDSFILGGGPPGLVGPDGRPIAGANPAGTPPVATAMPDDALARQAEAGNVVPITTGAAPRA